jgi:hypothetical protein
VSELLTAQRGDHRSDLARGVEHDRGTGPGEQGGNADEVVLKPPEPARTRAWVDPVRQGSMSKGSLPPRPLPALPPISLRDKCGTSMEAMPCSEVHAGANDGRRLAGWLTLGGRWASGPFRCTNGCRSVLHAGGWLRSR